LEYFFNIITVYTHKILEYFFISSQFILIRFWSTFQYHHSLYS
jgi:hypothetical protein